jgi:hypothetical protein
MKKLSLIGIIFGIASFVQATNITLVSNSSISGVNAYQYLISISLAPDQTISGASLSFNNVTLTSSDAKDIISADVINANYASQTFNDNDQSGDYFVTKYPSKTVLNLGVEKFTAPYWSHRHWVYDTESWSDVFSSAALAIVNTRGGIFDIGIDPDCIYTIGSIVFSYTTKTTKIPNTPVPDTAMTAGLLGMSFLGLLLFRRKLAFN